MFVTTDAVLTEVLAFSSHRGVHARNAAVESVEQILASKSSAVVHQDRPLFLAGLDLYRQRIDKQYSLTDCMSMIVCRQQQITDVLTHDHHFMQEGFTILL